MSVLRVLHHRSSFFLSPLSHAHRDAALLGQMDQSCAAGVGQLVPGSCQRPGSEPRATSELAGRSDTGVCSACEEAVACRTPSAHFLPKKGRVHRDAVEAGELRKSSFTDLGPLGASWNPTFALGP